MIKVKVSPARFAEACNVMEYLAISGGNTNMAMRVIPRFILNKDGEYIVKAVLDEDGDIKQYDGLDEAIVKFSAVTPTRAEKLAQEIVEAAKGIVNPQSGGG